MKHLLSLLLAGFCTVACFGQGLSSSYVKAKNMLEGGYFEDADRAFTSIIIQDPSYKDALIHRANARLILGRAESAESDLNDFINLKGITSELLPVYAQVKSALGNSTAASNTIEAAEKCGNNSADFLFAKASVLLAQGYNHEACETFLEAKRKGSFAAKNFESDFCKEGGDVFSDKKVIRKNKNGKVMIPKKTTKTPTKPSHGKVLVEPGQVDEVTEDDILKQNQQTEPEPEPEPEIDMSVNEVEMDEDLTLVFMNGIGGRKILKTPNILMLSNATGIVAIDVKINMNGKVEFVEANKAESTLSSQSLISLAIRKSKEFWFEKTDQELMEGTILYKITAN